jgi:rod shape-determining protein MreB and related proteins
MGAWLTFDIYIVEWSVDAFRIRLVGEPTFVSHQPDHAFSHPRMLVGHFNNAESALKKVLSARKRSFLSASPHLVMHIREPWEGGLTQIEERVFIEVGLGAGASKVRVHAAPNALSDAQAIALFAR